MHIGSPASSLPTWSAAPRLTPNEAELQRWPRTPRRVGSWQQRALGLVTCAP